MILLPFTAHQLDLSLRLERLGCCIILHPSMEAPAHSRASVDDGTDDAIDAVNDTLAYDQLKSDTAKALTVLRVRAESRVPFERNIAWLHSILTSEGGVVTAADYVETIGQHNDTILSPYSEQIEWWRAAALDVYSVCICMLLFLWLTTKACVGAVWILWRNLAQADLTKLD